MLGAAASRPRLGADLGEFLARTRIPFFTTQMGKGVVAGRPLGQPVDLWLGTAALSERDYVHEAIDRADVIVAIGHDTVEKPPFLMGPGGPTVIHVGYTPPNIEEVYFPHASVVGDIGPTLTMLADRLEGDLPHASALLPLRDGILAHISAGADDDRFPIVPQRIVADVRAVMPADGIVALDNGMYKIWFARSYRTPVSNTLLLDNALATMGAGLPSAMMAALTYPDRRVLAVCGDGGFMMNSQELETAVRLGLNLVVLDPAGRRLRDDPLEAGRRRVRRLRHDLRQPGLRGLRAGLRRPRFRGWSPPRTSSRSCSRRSNAVACTSWSRRSTTPRTPASSSTSCKTVFPHPRRFTHHDHQSRCVECDGCRVAIRVVQAAHDRDVGVGRAGPG